MTLWKLWTSEEGNHRGAAGGSAPVETSTTLTRPSPPAWACSIVGTSPAMWRRWRDLEWIDRFGYSVIACFLVTIVGLAICSVATHDELPEPALTPTMSTTLSEPSGGAMALHTADVWLRGSTTTTEASQGMLGP